MRTLTDAVHAVKSTGTPVVAVRWPKGTTQATPYVCWVLDSTRNAYGDDRVTVVIGRYDFELYADQRNLTLERSIEAAFDAAGIAWSKSGAYIEAEDLVETIYSTDLIEK